MKKEQMNIGKQDIMRLKWLLRGAMMVVLGLFLNGTAFAQSVDFSGLWYIANSPNIVGDENNFYLVPGRDPRQAHYADAYFNDQYCNTSGSGDYTGDNYGDPEKPFITTHKIDLDAEAENLFWRFVATGDGYYYIIHNLTGKYMVYDPPYKDATNRKSVRLQSVVAPNEPGDNAKFAITGTSLTDYINISPKSLSGWYLNPANSNINAYYGTNGTNNPYLSVGMVGVYNSTSGNSRWRLEIPKPMIEANETTKTVNIRTIEQGATVYYTLDGSTPNLSSSSISPQNAFNGQDVNIGPEKLQVKIMAYRNGVSSGIVAIWVDFRDEVEISSLDQIIDKTRKYKLTADIDASSHTTIENFTGRFNGQFHTISGLTQPLFGTLDGGNVTGTIDVSGSQIIVRNVILDNVGIVNHEGATGAIACQAKGNVCIYNCGILSGSVGGTGDTGGLVGVLDKSSNGYSFARVVNCFSYANITGSGTYAAGIVGNNNYNSTAADYYFFNTSRLRTAVVNCMFYGDVLAGTNKYPVYGNQRLANNEANGINNYDYFMATATLDDDYPTSGANPLYRYNSSWPAEERYLNRYEYYRSILNSNRRLCTWWVTQKQYANQTEDDLNLIAKWVLDPTIAPFPILKPWGKYPSLINPDPNNVLNENNQWISRDNAKAYQGKKLGTLTVTVKAGSNNSGATDKTLQLPIIDMDTLHHDFGYAKVQLPYYNEQFGNPNAITHAAKYGNNYTDKVVTGWKITSVTGGTQGTFVADWESGYDFADRYCTDKDLYSVSKRVFAQGGYYYVPEGVTSITIEAYWGNAIYLHNAEHYMDRVNLGGNAFAPAGTMPAMFNGQTVCTTIQEAIAELDLEGNDAVTVYDQAIVLVGNLQYRNNGVVEHMGWDDGTSEEFATHNRPYTFTSVDLDFDNEPDYCFEWQFSRSTERKNLHPVRFDFLPIPALGMAIRTGAELQTIGVFAPRGHFEITETAFMHTGQFEYETRSNYRKKEAPLILNGGQFEQFVSSQTWDNSNVPLNRTTYIILGGHVWMKEFTPGKHGDANVSTRHCAVSVLGGEYDRLCLSGVFVSNDQTQTWADNPHCYTSGGKFGTISGAGMEQINGNVTFKIDHSLIGEFYGGGLNAAKPIQGSIDVTINNSIVGKYCGGPYTGDMLANTTVTTMANNTVFGVFYGAGNGGTNYNRNRRSNASVSFAGTTEDWWRTTGKFDEFDPLNHVSVDAGYEAQFEFELIDQSSSSEDYAILRTYRHEAQFTATEVKTVTSTLTGCTVLGNFYGAGNLGKVTGDVTSTLENTTVYGSAFGGGFSAETPSFPIHDKSTVVFPFRDLARVNHPGLLDYVKDDGKVRYYKWIHDLPAGVSATTSDPAFNYNGEWYCFTEKEMTNLGSVEGSTTITLKGNCTIGTLGKSGTGNVFGGGDESAVNGSTLVKVLDQTKVFGNIYGGGNMGTVGGNTKVIVNGTMPQP